jgi:hypothetical protein
MNEADTKTQGSIDANTRFKASSNQNNNPSMEKTKTKTLNKKIKTNPNKETIEDKQIHTVLQNNTKPLSLSTTMHLQAPKENENTKKNISQFSNK